MNGRRLMNLNLATHPLRNRRAFFWLAAVLSVSTALVLALAILYFVRYHFRRVEVDKSLAEVSESIRIAEDEDRRFTERAGTLPPQDKQAVDVLNGIIYKKSFSWTEFLSKLEEALPATSYLASIAPNFREDSSLELKFKVVSQTLDDHIALITNLNALKFTGIMVQNEDTNERGQIVSEISLTYERHD
jgi:Tfp pilus assembly protein PilN